MNKKGMHGITLTNLLRVPQTVARSIYVFREEIDGMEDHVKE